MKTFYTMLAPLIAISISVLALVHAGAMTTNFGATANAGANALYEQSLAQPLGTTDANMYVTSGADIQGNLLPLNSYQCLSVDTGQPNFEAICGNVTASATSGLTLAVTIRGLSTQTATTSNPSFIFTHRRGADVRITDFPALTVVNNQLSGTQVIPNAIYYSSNFTPSFWTTAPSSTLATLGIVNSTAAAGCGNANETASGCSQLATSLQLALGTSLGSTNARLVIGNNLATSTPYNGGTNVIPVTGTNEKLSQLFLDLTQAFTWSALNTFTSGFLSTASSTINATTTIAASNVLNKALVLNGIPYAFPSSQGGLNSTFINNGSGGIAWGNLPSEQYSVASTTALNVFNNVTVTYLPLTVPAGILSASSTVNTSGVMKCSTSGSGGTCTVSLIDTNANTYCTLLVSPGTSATAFVQFNMNSFANGSVSSQSGTITALQLISSTFTDDSTACGGAVNWANAVNFEIKLVTSNSTGVSATLSPFTLTVRP